MKKGLFISVEGPDGSGKTSAIPVIAAELRAQGYSVCETREPGGTAVADQIREILIHEDPSVECIDPVVQTTLFIAARLQHLKRVIIPNVREGRIVLCDRYIDSTMVYQGHGKMMNYFIQQLHTLPAYAPAAVRPDYTFFFDASEKVCSERQIARGRNALDVIHSKMNVSEVFRNHFTFVGKRIGNDRIKTINADRDQADVSRQIARAVAEIQGHQFSSLTAPGQYGFVTQTTDVDISTHS